MALTLEALETLDAIARNGSFAAAAIELGKVPSALTYTVRKLEDDLDVLIFDRRGARAQFTAAGRELLEAGRGLLRSADDLARRVHRVATGWEPELRIAVDALIEFDALRPLIEDFCRAGHPTRLRITSEVLDGNWEALLEGRADLVIGAPYDAPRPALASTRFSLRPLGRIGFVFCAAPHHTLSQAPEPLSSDLIAAHRAIAMADTSRQPSLRTSGLLQGQETLTVATLQQKVALQIAGLGVGWLPESVSRPLIAQGVLRGLRTLDPKPPATLQYGWRRTDPGKALKWWLSRLELPRVRERLVSPPENDAPKPATRLRRSAPVPTAKPSRARRALSPASIPSTGKPAS